MEIFRRDPWAGSLDGNSKISYEFLKKSLNGKPAFNGEVHNL